MRGAVVALALLAGAGPASAGPSMRAERIAPESAPDLLIGGPDAIGGIGDWYLANDLVEAIVDDPGREHGALGHGGSLVDVGLRDRRGEDQFARLWPLLNLDQRVYVNYERVRAESDEGEGWARLLVSSRGMGSLRRGGFFANWMVPEPGDVEKVAVETEYAVLRGEPWIYITTTFRNQGEGSAPVFAYGDVWMRGGRSMRAFVGNALAPERSHGFHHAGFDRNDLFANPEALATFTHVSVPGVREFPPIAYALFSPERTRKGLFQFGVTGRHVNLMNVFAGDPAWDELGLLRLARATFLELEPGATWSHQRRLLVTGRSDVASTTDHIFRLLGVADGRSGVEGRVEPPDAVASVQVEQAESGAPVTQIVPATEGDAAGSYRAVLPPGRYRLRFRSPQRPERALEVQVSPGGFARVETWRVPEPGWLVFAPAFADAGPGRIVVRAAGGGAGPRFGAELLDFRIDGERVQSASESDQLRFLGNEHDPGRVAIPPGRYELTASRGLEWSAERVAVEVPGPGAEVRVPAFRLERAVELPGLWSADLHVHGEASDDSAMTNRERLASYLAEGIDVMVSTDHDHVGAFDAAVAGLGLSERIRVVHGVEATSSAPSPQAPWTIGHTNAWPIPYRPLAHRRGAPPTQNRRLADLVAELRRDYGARVVQLNHARANGPDEREEGAFLTHLGDAGEPFRPDLPLSAEPNRRLLEPGADGVTRGLDFDAMELVNGRRFRQHLLLRADWHSLLRQGHRRTGTANSDSHGPEELAGYPRNYVRIGSEAFDPAAFDAAIRQGRLFGTNGPLLAEFRVNGAGMGETAAAPDGRAEVEIRVAAAPWVPVDEVRLLRDGEVVRRWTDLAAAAPIRLEVRERLALDRDAFVGVEAGVPLDADPVAWAASHPGLYTQVLAPGFLPVLFSNPIWVDVDGNGRFDAPGLAP